MLNVCVYDDLDDDYDVCSSPCSYRQPVGRGQLLSRRYCKHSGWLFLCAKYTLQSSQGALAVSRKYFKKNSLSGRPWLHSYTPIRQIDQIYAQKDIRVCEVDHLKPPTVSGSFCTRSRIDRTLICNAILYHFQITSFCGRFNRPFIPLTLFLLSRPLEQLEFIR